MTFSIILRCLIIYLIVLFLMRLMGKRQIGEMQPFEFAITLIIADLATIPMAEISLPILHGVLPLLTLALIHFFLSFLERKSLWLRNVINGKPVILIGPTGINFKNLKKCNMNFNDLQEALHSAGYFNLDEILYAVLQTNGNLSVLPRSAFAPATPDGLKVEVDSATYPIIVYADGAAFKENMDIAEIDEAFLINQIKICGFNSLKEIMIITLDSKGKLFIQGMTGNFHTLQSNKTGKW